MAEVPVLAPAEGTAAPAPPKRAMALWLVIVIGVAVLAVGIGAGAGLSHVFRGAASARALRRAGEKPSGPPHYLALDPPFVVNFQADQLVRFLQVSVQVMSHDPKTLSLVRQNDPVVRNALLLLFANQKYSVLATRAGKQRLRLDALAAIRNVVARSGGDPKRIEAVYFTSFVMQ
jgi:flagellar FliL protein